MAHGALRLVVASCTPPGRKAEEEYHRHTPSGMLLLISINSKTDHDTRPKNEKNQITDPGNG